MIVGFFFCFIKDKKYLAFHKVLKACKNIRGNYIPDSRILSQTFPFTHLKLYPLLSFPIRV